MLILYNVEVVKTRRDRHEITWDARPSSFTPPESVDDYNFKILWSFDPISDFEPILNSDGSEVVIDGAVGPFYHVHDYKHTPHDRQYYYKVIASRKANPALYTQSKPVFIGDQYDGILETMRYAEEVLYDMYVGEPVYLSKKKEGQGSRCPECWNPLQFKRMKGKCSTCHGSGFIDGYFTPIEIQVAFDSDPKTVKIPIVGEQQTKVIKARASNFPIINPRDMITNMDDYRRWEVSDPVNLTKLPNVAINRQNLSRSNYIVSQLLNLSELDPADPRYDVILVGQDLRGSGDPGVLDLSSSGNAVMQREGGVLSSESSTVSGSGSVS